MKIRQLKLSCYMWTDGRTEIRTDRHAVANCRFRNFANAPTKFTYLQLVLDLNEHYSATLHQYSGAYSSSDIQTTCRFDTLFT